jgi:hypothetical protein
MLTTHQKPPKIDPPSSVWWRPRLGFPESEKNQSDMWFLAHTEQWNPKFQDQSNSWESISASELASRQWITHRPGPDKVEADLDWTYQSLRLCWMWWPRIGNIWNLGTDVRSFNVLHSVIFDASLRLCYWQ